MPCMCQSTDPDIGKKILAAVEKNRAYDADQMPDEAAALRVMQRAHQRLKDLGFYDAQHCPRDGVTRQFVEVGSSGIHEGYRDNTGVWLFDGGDLWPSRPVLYRNKPAAD